MQTERHDCCEMRSNRADFVESPVAIFPLLRHRGMPSKPSYFKHRKTGEARDVEDPEWALVAFPDGRVLDGIKRRWVRGSINGCGYRILSTGQHVHTIIAQQMIPNPEGKPFVDHINGWKCDNRVENLRWATPRENAANYQDHRDNSREYKILFDLFSARGQRQEMDSHLPRCHAGTSPAWR
jgi:hypothetical protein